VRTKGIACETTEAWMDIAWGSREDVDAKEIQVLRCPGLQQ
jgi:hypothetical protein